MSGEGNVAADALYGEARLVGFRDRGPTAFLLGPNLALMRPESSSLANQKC